MASGIIYREKAYLHGMIVEIEQSLCCNYLSRFPFQTVHFKRKTIEFLRIRRCNASLMEYQPLHLPIASLRNFRTNTPLSPFLALVSRIHVQKHISNDALNSARLLYKLHNNVLLILTESGNRNASPIEPMSLLATPPESSECLTVHLVNNIIVVQIFHLSPIPHFLIKKYVKIIKTIIFDLRTKSTTAKSSGEDN
jgi:hypothetical protein